jgi:hypothetical protein
MNRIINADEPSVGSVRIIPFVQIDDEINLMQTQMKRTRALPSMCFFNETVARKHW